MVLRLTGKPRKTVTIDGRSYTIDPNDMRSIVVPGPVPVVAFNGDFAALLTSAGVTTLHYWQPDRLLVEDTTLRHTAGSGPVITLSGTRTGAPTSIIITTTLGGALGVWTGLVTYVDGTTQAFTSGATVALTGRGAGLTLNIAAGTAVIATDVWQACAATLTDPVTGFSLASDGPTKSPLITTGINGRAGISTDGVNTFLHNNTVDLPAPSFTLLAACRRLVVPGSNAVMFGGDTGFFASIRSLLAGGCDMFNTSTVNVNSGLTANTWGFLIASFTNSTGDSFKFGSAAPVTGANAGPTNPGAGRSLGALINGSSPSSNEYLWGAWVAGGIPSNIATIKSKIDEWYGAGSVPE